ncbi:MAG: hypothetical protein M1832_004731 [Thelocarpon impressellum]|nr:MAG: hypothetical protein M1832_004731 [Thelocarpon impressellum]
MAAMAEQVLHKVQDTLEGEIDFEGQRLAETLTTYILIASGVRHVLPRFFIVLLSGIDAHRTCQIIAVLVGFVLQDIHLSLYSGLAGTALAFAVVVPPWPYFNKHPLRWLPSGSSLAAKVGIVVDGKKVT